MEIFSRFTYQLESLAGISCRCPAGKAHLGAVCSKARTHQEDGRSKDGDGTERKVVDRVSGSLILLLQLNPSLPGMAGLEGPSFGLLSQTPTAPRERFIPGDST